MGKIGLELRASVLAVAALASASIVSAQSAPQSRPITVTFTGTVTNSATDQVMIRQPDGSLAPYQGPMPDYPFRAGDQVQISFSTTVPTAAYYAGVGQVAADGIYRIQLRGPNNSSPVPFGGVNNLGVSTNGGQSGIRPTSEPFGIGGAVIVYNANTDSYALEFGNAATGTSTATAATFDAPGLTYNPYTGALTSDSSSCQNRLCPPQGSGGIALTLGANQVSANRIAVWGPDTTQPGGLVEAFWGLFDFGFSGSWNLPASAAGSSGGPVNVPEPGMMILFGASAVMLVRRRRRAI